MPLAKEKTERDTWNLLSHTCRVERGAQRRARANAILFCEFLFIIVF